MRTSLPPSPHPHQEVLYLYLFAICNLQAGGSRGGFGEDVLPHQPDLLCQSTGDAFCILLGLPPKEGFLGIWVKVPHQTDCAGVGQKPLNTPRGRADVDCPTQVPGVSSGSQLCL